MTDEQRKQFTEVLKELSIAQEKFEKQYQEEASEFWNSLSADDRLKAFYFVTSKIYEGDVLQKGSYRTVLYDVFQFGFEAYTIGMMSKYLELHNIIQSNLEETK